MKARPLFIGGQWHTTETVMDVVNPATGAVFEKVCLIDRKQVGAAIAAAHAAFEDWKGLTAIQRADYLLNVAHELAARSDEIARTITLENGKPLAQSKGEVAMSIDHLRWFAEEARRAYGRWVPQQIPGRRHLVIKSPVGVVGAISPWNFPLVLAVRKIAPALAAGCPVVLKPAGATPLCSLLFAECVERAGLPAGVFQVVLGKSSDIGKEFLENPLCRKISFTGSTEVGRVLIQGASKNIKPLSLELGGHAPLLVFEDADLDVAVAGTLIAKYRNTGQSCIAANRIYVQRTVYHEFLEKFVRGVQALKTGNGMEDGMDVGPLSDQGGLCKALEHIDDAVKRGAKILCGGKRSGETGFFLEPTVLADVPAESLCMHEETFAPVAVVVPFDTEEAGIEAANASPFGLSAYAFTSDLGRTVRVMEGLDAGTIGINEGAPTTSQCPFGGFKESGWGRELGLEGLDAYLETKHVCMNVNY